MSEYRLTRRGLILAGLGAPLCAAGQSRLDHSADSTVRFLSGERLLFAYRYSAERPKTYVHPFCAPDGTPLTLDGPEDHVHHRGLMIAWSKVNGYDFWGETNPAPHGRIEHVRFEKSQGLAELTDVLHWVADDKIQLIERRTIRALDGFPRTVALEWASEMAAAEAPVSIAPGKHPYNGLGIRPAASMDKGGVLNANGTREIKRANGEPARWCTYHGAIGGGRQAGVVIFDHPTNPRHPTPFFVMNDPFGYLSAAPTFREPFPRLEPGESIRLRYAVLSFLGEPEAAWLDEMYGRWAKS